MEQSSVLDIDLNVENLLSTADELPWPGVAPASDALIDFGVSASALAAPPTDAVDPHEQLWSALEHELQAEKDACLQQAFRHRLEKPEELPDLSNL